MLHIYSNHGALLDTKATLADAERCMWTWFSASFIVHEGKVVSRKSDWKPGQ
jgi:hypothetical protein